VPDLASDAAPDPQTPPPADSSSDTPSDVLPIVLPAPVRRRVLEVAAEVLGGLPPQAVPSTLARFARFEPRKRLQYAADAIAVQLATDPSFRSVVAEAVRGPDAPLVTAVEAGTVPAAADPVEVAAIAYLTRPDGWAALVSAVGDGGPSPGLVPTDPERARAITAAEQARAQAELLRGQARDAREKARRETDALRVEIVRLQQEVRTLKGEVRRAQTAAAQAEQARQAAEQAAQEQVRQAEQEVRRRRQEAEHAAARLEAVRRERRGSDSLGDARLGVLLDALRDAVDGLRRELDVTGRASPAELVTSAALPADVRGGRIADADALARQVQAPGAHLVVDGYNVTKAVWPTATLAQQRDQLARALAALVARTGVETTVVFDGADVGPVPQAAAVRRVRIRFSPAGTTADEVIRAIVAAEPAGRRVLVVSDDREVAWAADRPGGRSVTVAALRAYLGV